MILFAPLLFALCSHVWADDPDPDRASLVESNRPNESIAAIEWSKDSVRVEPKEEGNLSIPIATLRGRFKMADWILVRGETPIDVDPESGEFKVEVPLTAKATHLKLFAIGPFGEVDDEKLIVVYQGWASFGKRAQEIVYPSTNLTLGIGASLIQYSQTGVSDLSQKALTLKLSYQNELFSPRWDYGISGYVTAVPFSANQSGVSARFLGISGRVGYVLPQVSEPWRVVVMGGAYYTTMFTSQGSFGYANVGGPMLYPVVRRLLSGGDSIGGYFKFSPVSNGFAFLSLLNRELAFGMNWVHRFRGWKRPVLFSLDYANLDLHVQAVHVTSTSLTLGVGLAW